MSGAALELQYRYPLADGRAAWTGRHTKKRRRAVRVITG